MFARLAEASTTLDIGTLFVIATCVAALLGLFLLFAWLQDRIAALAWWGVAYLIGGFSGLLWRLDGVVPLPLSDDLADVLLFIALGMIWTAARVFHGRKVRFGAMCYGAIVWTTANLSPTLAHWPAGRTVLSSLIVANYTFWIAVELWRERRKAVIRQRWPALFVPTLHGAIFLFPVALANLGVHSLAKGWVAVFAIEVVLYMVGAAFIVLLLAKDRTVNRYKAAAQTDPLTGLLNRRGLFEVSGALMARNLKTLEPISVLAFDLDRFKSINDRFGHKMGDAVLDLFAKTVKKTMRGEDVIGRLGGEEFIAVISGALADARIAAERVRVAFEAAAALTPGSPGVPATVSVGVACGSPNVALDKLIDRADAALYRAKENGRNQVAVDEIMMAADADRTLDIRTAPPLRPAVLSVPVLVRRRAKS
jgi:diguanylate cyclase (GGDEF)-like protein